MDVFLEINESQIIGPNEIRVRSQDYWKTLKVTDGPITKGGKYTSPIRTMEAAAGLKLYDRSGGCGYNSAKANKRKQRKIDYEVRLLDEVTPRTIINDRVAYWDIKPFFFYGRKAGINLAFSHDGDKIIIRGPVDQPHELRPQDYYHAEMALKGAQALLINNLKHPDLLKVIKEIARNSGIPVYFGATTSPSLDFAVQHMLPDGPVTVNFEDSARFNGLSNKDIAAIPEKEVVDAALEFLKGMLGKGMVGEFPVVNTLGRHGMVIWTPSGDFRHVSLQQQYTQRVHDHLITDIRGSLGGGDYFIGGWFDELNARLQGEMVDPRSISIDSLDEVVRLANLHSIFMMRCDGVTPPLSAFNSVSLN